MKEKIREVIVVEGRYDKNTLSQVVDAVILETSGFGVFKDKERLALLRRLAEQRRLTRHIRTRDDDDLLTIII